ncbi:hypothetical protein SC1_03607 [Sphingopyxis sp. C-1]|nr:hypothetical protein SC1_03607 [Sphingopyxis sp. C-1]
MSPLYVAGRPDLCLGGLDRVEPAGCEDFVYAARRRRFCWERAAS